ncbi:hypothetical protein N658DRAFT_500189 [Parathielavia hyrcaniae]|uniref:Uncharacterized protein n=1 Tax=Parathielavia hyrcaniae TaxID=113614 RepID=A0AAN6PW04_9PEZI|nr:hypothetical protein N658DRAFT_500189 [Parathielavia hyrcaniae]
MYRTRIRKWGIDKNNKAAEVAYMVRLKKQRDLLGKKSNFLIRNRPVDWDGIERYLARTPDFWAKHGRDQLDLSHEITCKTPTPDSPRIVPLASTSSVPPNLDAAQELRVHEEILRFFRDYTEGAFEQGLWHLAPSHQRYVGRGGVAAHARLNAWYDRVRNVSDWPAGRDADAVRLVNRLLDDLPQLVRDQDFAAFPALMRCCFYLCARRPPLGSVVVQFVARLCAVVLGETHPMALAWARIRALPMSEYLLVLQGTAKVRLDHLESRRRKDEDENGDGALEDENTINAMREYLLVLRLRGSAAAGAEIDHVTCRVKEQVISSRRGKGLSAAQCRLLLGTASSYITCQRFAEAEEVLTRVGAHLIPTTTASASSPLSPNNADRVLPSYLFIMGFLRYVTGRMDEAVNYFLRTYFALEKARGPHSSAVADILLALIDFPGLLQKPEEIQRWQGKFAQVQAEILANATAGVGQMVLEDGEMLDGPLDTDVNTGAW